MVLFNPATIIDRSTYDDPHQYPAGIGTVIVNGTVVIEGGDHTGALPGRLLRRRGTVLGWASESLRRGRRRWTTS